MNNDLLAVSTDMFFPLLDALPRPSEKGYFAFTGWYAAWCIKRNAARIFETQPVRSELVIQFDTTFSLPSFYEFHFFGGTLDSGFSNYYICLAYHYHIGTFDLTHIAWVNCYYLRGQHFVTGCHITEEVA